MKFLKVILLLPLLLSAYACAMVDSASRELMPREEASAPKVYYVGVAGLKMYPQNRASG